MNNIIQTDYTIRTYGNQSENQTGTRTRREEKAAGGSFSDLATQTLAGKTIMTDRTAAPYSFVSAKETAAINAPSLENMLKAKYPGIAYHVFDASTSYWRTRNDYPHYLLYRQDCDTEALENWRPSGPNPFYGSIDGQFIAPREIHALGDVPPGSKAVVIHPDVQKRMEEDPDYAYEIMAAIDNWFAYDVARNEALMPGSTAGMSQAVAIGKDGTVVNAAASKAGGTLTRSSDEMVKAYYRRLEKRHDFYRWLERYKLREQILYPVN